ncbi:hypothetical protein [Halomonas denitrificans]|nr:hypothetical protein [Halomonas denitrificans]
MGLSYDTPRDLRIQSGIEEGLAASGRFTDFGAVPRKVVAVDFVADAMQHHA